MTLPPPDQQSIRDAITREESRLLRLEEELTEAQARLLSLKAALAAQSDSTEMSLSGDSALSTSSTVAEKVALFRSRFRGREDIYPRFWSNARTGRHGYAPACGNEWVRGVCEKPRVKCGECPNKAFLPVEDQVILAARSRSTLVLVHRQPLLDQWIAQLSMFLGLAPKTIGQIGAGKHAPNGRLARCASPSTPGARRRNGRSITG